MITLLPVLRSELGGIQLRPYTPDDHLAIAQILLDNRTWGRGFGESSARIPADIHDALALATERVQDVVAVFAVEGASTMPGTTIGTTGITLWDQDKETVKIGRTLLSPDVWGQGFNHELKVMVLDWIFSQGIGRVECDVAPTNINSMRSLERFGFTFEGVRRRSVKRTDGTWRDTSIFSMLEDEWVLKREYVLHHLQMQQLRTTEVSGTMNTVTPPPLAM